MNSAQKRKESRVLKRKQNREEKDWRVEYKREKENDKRSHRNGKE